MCAARSIDAGSLRLSLVVIDLFGGGVGGDLLDSFFLHPFTLFAFDFGVVSG